jgi:outer membrane protein OmpA-like peptidoglycan-associated protein
MTSRWKEFLNDLRGHSERPAPTAPGDDRGHWIAEAQHEQDSPGPGFSAGALVAGLVVSLAALVITVGIVGASVGSAKRRLAESASGTDKSQVAIAQEAEVEYCTKDFKTVLERVLHSCGLSTETDRRGCKPSDIKTFAAISDTDFNSLFHPLKERGGVLLFDEGKEDLDPTSKKLLEERWFDRKGARYFFVVARASKTGTPDQNRALSHRRANSVMFYLKEISGESEEELNRKVGLLWLGNEYAQLSEDYCLWPRSRMDAAECDQESINRSAFVSWVDCRL